VEIKVATANIAGAAREEKANPCKYEMLGKILSEADIIGLQEVVKVEDAIGNFVRDDIEELQKNGLSDYHHYFFPHLDSTQQSHPDKWKGKKGKKSAFSSDYYEKYRVQQGTAVLVKSSYDICDLWDDKRQGQHYVVGQIIPWYLEKPTFYKGDRDTEPRSLLLARIQLEEERFVLFCCTQLTTLTEEKKGDERVPTCAAVRIRTKQINWIVDYIKDYQDAYQQRHQESCQKEPIILVGDFNAESIAGELGGLQTCLGLKLVELRPSQDVSYTHRNYNILIDLIYATRETIDGSACIIDLEELEKTLPDKRRISDHNAVIAKLSLR